MGVMRAIIFLCLLAASCLSVLHQDTTGNHGWKWAWLCKGGKCVKSERPRTAKSISGTSEAICKLTCGRYGGLWPQPTGQTILGHQLIAFHPSRLSIEIGERNREARELLERSSKIWQARMYADCGLDCTLIPDTQITVQIKTSSPQLALNWTTDESYYLNISTKDNAVLVTIDAKTVYGARHGLETAGQLTTVYTDATSAGARVLVMVAQATVTDAPVFPHRGLLLDTARNFLPLSAIMRTIDGMAHVKLNVLHWHATDTQSFPLLLPTAPQMAMYGAYSYEKTYNAHDIAQIVEYGRVRGVRTIIEIDTPAHSGNGWQWGESAGLGKLAVCVNQQPWRSYCIQPPCGQLNPANANTYAVLKDLYQDLLQILPPGEVFHMGGDEVFLACWNSSQEVISYMAERGLDRTEAGFLQLWADFQDSNLRVFDAVSTHESPIILWSSHLTQPQVIETYLNKSRYVIETWVETNQTLPTELLEKGYKLILATKDTWYLDHGFWGSTQYHSWRVAYDNKLPTHPGVLGGEAAMWAELVDDNSLDSKVWPRAGAVAERLWTNPTSKSVVAEPRLQQLRVRLTIRGIHADAISPEYCSQNELQCA